MLQSDTYCDKVVTTQYVSQCTFPYITMIIFKNYFMNLFDIYNCILYGKEPFRIKYIYSFFVTVMLTAVYNQNSIFYIEQFLRGCVSCVSWYRWVNDTYCILTTLSWYTTTLLYHCSPNNLYSNIDLWCQLYICTGVTENTHPLQILTPGGYYLLVNNHPHPANPHTKKWQLLKCIY